MGKRLDWIKEPALFDLVECAHVDGLPRLSRLFTRHCDQNSNPESAIRFAETGGGQHGYLGATRELTKASIQWMASKGDFANKLRGDERRAYDTAADMGVFSNTNAQMLAKGGGSTGPKSAILKWSTAMFNAAEHLNRMSTYMAGYRLGRTQGMDHDAAVEHGMDMAWRSHFDYGNTNRPRILQNDVTKVATLFRQYEIGMAYRLVR